MGKQYLTFTLADTIYAVNVFQVREVLSYVTPQALPNSDPIIEGLIRSRDQSISVINLRRRFGLEDRKPDQASRIIVLEVRNAEEGTESVFGAVADSVNEVLDLDTIGCEETPDLGNSSSSVFIEGIGRQNDQFIIILDVDKIFSFSEISEIERAAVSSAEAENENDGNAPPASEEDAPAEPQIAPPEQEEIPPADFSESQKSSEAAETPDGGGEAQNAFDYGTEEFELL